MTPFQIGARSGHRGQEHIFVLKSIMGLYEYLNKPLLISGYDVSKFFDFEQISDVLSECHKLKVKGKIYRLLYRLNEKRNIKVLTPLGETEEAKVDEGISQGSIESGTLSSGSLDQGVNEGFKNSEYEITYGNISLQPQIFLDDLIRCANSILNAQAGNVFLEAILSSKGLRFNLSKSTYIVMNDVDNVIKKELNEKPIKLCGKKMTQSQAITYLGEQISEKGVAASAKETIAKRYGRAKQLILEIKAIIEDCRSNREGAIFTGIQLFQLSVVPYIYYSSELWVSIPPESIQQLNDLHELLYRVMFGTSKSCPKVILYTETGSLLPINIIKEHKAMFYFHLNHLDQHSLAYKIYNEQRRLRLPGYVKEAQEILAELNIREGTVHSSTKAQFRSLVKSAIKARNTKDLLEMSKGYKKVNYFDLQKEEITMKEYIKTMDLNGARTMFAHNSQTMKHIKLNQMNHEPYSKVNWRCHECSSISSSRHIKWCPAYSHLREDLSLERDDHLIKYLQEVIKIREDADNKE